jgi:hypothetical protein
MQPKSGMSVVASGLEEPRCTSGFFLELPVRKSSV